ncbi:MAG: hypothetical protein Q7R22_001795 [Verrucomicrobiota bacterium JB025]|nr:hypothetical protein [Verrucomicrobiota bacterium JB025]
METVVQVPEFSSPQTISEVLSALKKQHLTPKHEHKAWGDWIHLADYQTVISIEVNHGLTSSATIEHHEDEENDGEPAASIIKAFAKLGWNGVDEDGQYPL